MGLDRRLRDELHRQASSIEPDTTARLEVVVGRRGPGAPWGGVLAGAATAVLLVAVLGATLPLGRNHQAPTGTTWTVVLAPDDPGAADLGMTGAWSLRLGDRATIELTTPPAFSPEAGPATDGYVYTLDGTSLTTNLFSRDRGAPCAGPATYGLSVDGDRLTFTGSDSCDPRTVLLETRAWTAAPDPSP